MSEKKKYDKKDRTLHRICAAMLVGCILMRGCTLFLFREKNRSGVKETVQMDALIPSALEASLTSAAPGTSQAGADLYADMDIESIEAMRESRQSAPRYLDAGDVYSKNSGMSTETSLTDLLTDNQGNTYLQDRMICSRSYDEEGVIEYDLGCAYRMLTGTVYVPDASKSVDINSMLVCAPYVRIYGDDCLLYELDSLSGKDRPVDFCLDVSGVEYLSVHLYGGWYDSDRMLASAIPINCVADLQVTK